MYSSTGRYALRRHHVTRSVAVGLGDVVAAPVAPKPCSVVRCVRWVALVVVVFVDSGLGLGLGASGLVASRSRLALSSAGVMSVGARPYTGGAFPAI
jgi:hypothetical protein